MVSLMCYSPQPHHHHLILLSMLVCFPKFRPMEEHYFQQFVLNMVKGHHLHLGSCSSFFHYFQWFNIKAAAAHHPITQKEVDELLAKGTIELLSCDAGFLSSVYVVPKCTGGLKPILNLKQLNHYMYMPIFKICTIIHVWQLIKCGDYAFSINLKDPYLHILVVKHHYKFLQFV